MPVDVSIGGGLGGLRRCRSRSIIPVDGWGSFQLQADGAREILDGVVSMPLKVCELVALLPFMC